MENVIVSVLIVLIIVAIIAEYKIHQKQKTEIQTEPEKEEFNLENETNEVIQTVCIQEQNFAIQDIKEECEKINYRIALTNILLLIIAIALGIIAYCTLQDYLLKRDIINSTNNAINEIFEYLN